MKLRIRASRLASVALSASVLALPVSGQAVRGVVVERDSYEPVNLGTVVMVTAEGDTVGSALTDDSGFFSIRAERGGRFYLVASALGYRAIRSERFEVEDGGDKVVQLSMSPAPIPVQGVLVEGEASSPPEVFELVANGFYDRMMLGRGEFLTPQDIAAADVPYTPQLFRELALVRLDPPVDRKGGPWNDQVMMRNVTLRGVCQPTLYVDGLWVELMPGEGLNDLVPKETLEAVEVYHALNAPPQYLRKTAYLSDGCGVILFWTISR